MKKKYILCLLGFSLILPIGCQHLPGQSMPGGPFTQPAASNNISAAVQHAFASEPLLAGLPIQVEAQDGRVLLRGYVKSIRQSDMAAFLASKVNGVKTIENNLIVRK